MCNPNFTGHKVCEKQLGDLRPGERYRTPDRRTLMVLVPDDDDGYTRAADVDTGEVFNHHNSMRLGRDQEGRLYASRSLNPGLYPPTTEQALQDNLDANAAADMALEVQLNPDAAAAAGVVIPPPDHITGFNNRHED